MRRHLRHAAILLLIICGASRSNVFGWNRTGHKVIVLVAYQQLSGTAKANIGRLLALHPDYPSLSRSKGFADPTLSALLEASVWPDTIRNDPRFYDEADAERASRPPLAGFLDMSRHQSWHYVDTFFSNDGARLPAQSRGEALRQIVALRRSLADISASGATRAYQLAWLIHIASDVHQPLHCTSRVTSNDRSERSAGHAGDEGGNLLFVEGGDTLHWFWDSAAGSGENPQYLKRRAARAEAQAISREAVSAPPEAWIEEGFEIAKAKVYSFRESGSKTDPIRITESYRAMAHQIALQRMALAGARLASILEEIFGR